MMKKYFGMFLLPLVASMQVQAADPFNDPFFQDPFGDDIFKEMMQMQQRMDEMFERMHQRMLQRTRRAVGPVAQFGLPAQSGFVDKGDHYELHTTIPESKENHIDIKTENGMLSITAKVVEEHEEKTANGVAKSSAVRVYQQAMSLPTDADTSTISTKYAKGRLLVLIGKKGNIAAKTVPAPSKAEKPSKTVPIKPENKQSDKPEHKKDAAENNASIKKMTINSDVPSMS
jgi:HSP20 family protein